MTPVSDDVAGLLTQSALFDGFDPGSLGQVANHFVEIDAEPRSGIIGEGSRGPDFFVIIEGTAEVVRDGQVVATLRPGDFFGEVAALDDGPRTATVQTAAGVRCAAVPEGEFKQLLLDYPLFAVNLLNQMVRRFRTLVSSKASSAPQ